MKMTMNMLEMAKQLISKGNELNDSQLVTMGYEMLEKYSDAPTSIVVAATESQSPARMYMCDHCDYTFPYDRDGRKACPNCKKRGLRIWPEDDELPVETTPSKTNVEDFQTQIRNRAKTRIRYNENGEVEGMYTRTEQVNGVKNEWEDDGMDRNDPVNEKLKAITKVSARTRKPVKLVTVVCAMCKREEQMHPLHVGGRARYICSKCLRRGVRS